MRRLVLASLIVWGCAAADTRPTIQRVPVPALATFGISGTAESPTGVLWAVAEDARLLFEIREADDRWVVRAVRLDGVPDGLEAESLAFVDATTVAIGTEQRGPDRDSDVVLFATIQGNVAVVQSVIRLDHVALWGLHAHDNEGIEGLCHDDGVLLAAAEGTDRTSDGHRWAPIARYDLETGDWTPFRLLLTTETGKISALECEQREQSGHTAVLAIERHYGVTRVLEFRMPLAGPGRDLVPRVVADLPMDRREMPNVEGISRTRGGQLLLLTDHDSPLVPGTTETILVGPMDEDDAVDEAYD